MKVCERGGCVYVPTGPQQFCNPGLFVKSMFTHELEIQGREDEERSKNRKEEGCFVVWKLESLSTCEHHLGLSVWSL